jgi:hypothetical protein
MRFRDAKPLAAIDVAPFVTYMEPEFLEEQDDGTDLPLPDLAQLAPDPPEPRGRRNRPGRPLRDTAGNSPIESATPPEQGHDEQFGQGLSTVSPADAPTGTQPAIDSEPAAKNHNTSSEKPRRRRRRKKRSKSDRSAEAAPNNVTEATSGTNAGEPEASAVSTAGAQVDSTGSEVRPRGKRRRRRRRGRRGAGTNDAAGTQEGQSPPTPDDTES